MRKTILMLTVIGLLSMKGLFGQISISGTVKDAENGESLPGVTVLVKGTSVGTTTDFDGLFHLTVPEEAKFITFSFVGMEPQEVPFTGQTTIDISLKANSLALEEIVVTAYGTEKKQSFTGSASVVGKEQIEKLQSSSITKALEGTTSGVQVLSSSGQPGEDAEIQIRGVGSINSSNNPLYVVDGVPYSGTMSSINPQDIESITVLKDAASAALFGSRGANGVVMITTKKGKEGKINVNVDAKFGVNSRLVPTYDIMTDKGEYLTTFWTALRNQAMSSQGLSQSEANIYASENLISELGGYNPYLNVENNEVVTPDGNITNAPERWSDDWIKEVFENGVRQEYNVNVSTGNEKSTSYMSIGYLNDEGIVTGSDYERITLRSNTDYKVNEFIKLGTNLSYANSTKNAPRSSSGNAFGNAFMFTQNIAPIYPVYRYDINGNRKYNPLTGEALYDFGSAGETDGTTGRPYGANSNPAATAAADLNRSLYDNLTSRSFVTISFLKDFNFTANVAYDYEGFQRDIFYTPLYGDAAQVNGRGYKYRTRTKTITANQLLTWKRSFNFDHYFDVLLGHENYDYNYNYLRGHKTNYFIEYNHEFNNAIGMQDLNSYTQEHKIESYFAQFKYNYRGKYYFSSSFRTDGSSKFHPDNRWGNFWSVGGTWRVTEEDFMDNISVINSLKVKSSYGVQGNDGILDNDGYIVYLPYQDHYEVVNSNGNPSTVLVYKGNKDLTWELSKNFNVGIEMEAFDSRLRFDFEYFSRATSDLLFNNPQPSSTGIAYIPENVADMTNKGIDFTIGYDIIKNDHLKWNVQVLGTHYKNEITSLPEDKMENGIVKGRRKLAVGHSIYDYYLVEYAGVAGVNEELYDGSNTSGGEALYYKVNEDGSKVKALYGDALQGKDGSRVFAGSALPDFQGSINNSLNYKNFDLSILCNFQLGGVTYDGNYASLMGLSSAGNNFHTDILDAWSPTNTGSDIPKLEYGYQDANQSSDRFLTSASFFNIRNITLGYTFDKGFLEKLQIQSLRLYVAADNVAFWSARKGLDPRQNLGQFFSGTSGFEYSALRTISGGLRINL